jgi:thioesterase domain-containing protein/glutathione synthase/RimK-type ligase-like ATP-grasp enzyme
MSWEDAGGDSMASLEMTLGLERLLGKHIPEHVMAGDLTPNLLLERLVDLLSKTSIPKTSLPKVFLCPAFSIKDFSCGRLAHALRNRFDPILLYYGIGKTEWYDAQDLDELVSRCAQQITNEVPNGPVHLIGYSWGGALAFDLACRLSASGRQVGFLAILDRTPFGARFSKLNALTLWRVRIRRSLSRRRYTAGGAFRALCKVFLRFGTYETLTSGVRALRRLGLQSLSAFATGNIEQIIRFSYFRTGYYPGRVWLFRSDDTRLARDLLPTDLDWDCYCETVTVIPVAGKHETILTPPHLENLTRLLISAADEAIAQRLPSSRAEPIQTAVYRGAGAPVPLLAFVSSADANLPLSRLIDDRVFQVHRLTVEHHHVGMPVPAHQVVFNAIGDADLSSVALARAAILARGSEVRVVNSPDVVSRTGRCANSARFRAIPDVVAPRIETFTRDWLMKPTAADELIDAGFCFPLLLRAPGYQFGRHFARIDDSLFLKMAVETLPGDELMVIDYVETLGSDSKRRKFRVMFVDGKLYPVHLAVSRHWKVHYFSSDMVNSHEHRAEEAEFLSDMKWYLGPRTIAALERVAGALGLDYGGIDFALHTSGDTVIFEANAMMIAKTPPAGDQWDYRRSSAERVGAAITEMLLDRAARPCATAFPST